MSATTENARNNLLALQQVHHPLCIVCGARNEHGLNLSFHACGEGIVEGVFACSDKFQGYAGYLHGGVISSLLDGAMCNCLFARGKAAMTGELTVKFLLPVRVNREAVVRAWIKESWGPLHLLEANMTQNSRIAAMATAKFAEVTNAHLETESGR